MKDTGSVTCSTQAIRGAASQLRSIARYLEGLLPNATEAGLRKTETTEYICRGSFGEGFRAREKRGKAGAK